MGIGKTIIWTSDRIPYDESLLDDLININFVNDYFTFLVDIKRVNQDFETLENMYEEVKKYYFVYKRIDRGTYEHNLSVCLENIEYILNFLKNLYENTVQLCAKSRVLLREGEKKTILFGIHVSNKYGENFDELVKKEVIKLKEEIEECKKKSQEEIDKLKGKTSEGKKP